MGDIQIILIEAVNSRMSDFFWRGTMEDEELSFSYVHLAVAVDHRLRGIQMCYWNSGQESEP